MADEMVMDAPAEVEVNDTPVDDVEQPEGEVTDITDTPEEAEASEGEDVEGEEADGEEEAEGQEQATPDGRKMPDGLKKAIASLKTTSPEVAKQIKGLYWSDQEYRAAFPKPADAVAAKTFLEEIGGQEGVQEIAAEREEWQQIDRDFAEGKKEFVTSLADNNPEGFLKTAPHVINEFATRAPEQYQYYANRLTLNTMANAGVSMQNLRGAYERFKDSNPEAAAVVAEVYNSLHDMNAKAAEFEQKRPDPREEQLKQRETQFEERRRADFEVKTSDAAKTFAYSKMQPEIDRIVAGRKVDADTMDGYKDMVKGELDRLFDAIPGIEGKLEANYRTGDEKKARTYIESKYQQLLPEAVKVIEKFVKNIPAASAKPAIQKPAANGKTAVSSPGSVVLKEMPDWNQIDFTKCTTADVAGGKAVLKSGKTATGWA